MSKEVDETIKNALNVEVKQRYGEDFFVKNSIVIALCEVPPRPDDKPDTPRFRIMLKTPTPIQASTAIRMLQEAGVQFQRQKLDIAKQEDQ